MMTTATETDCTISPTISHQHLHSLSRQTSKSSLLSMKLTLPNSGPGSPSSSSQRSIGYSYKSGSDSEQGNKNHHVPPMTYYVSGFSPWGNFSDLVSLRGHSQITLTKICLFFTPYPPLVDMRWHKQHHPLKSTLTQGKLPPIKLMIFSKSYTTHRSIEMR